MILGVGYKMVSYKAHIPRLEIFNGIRFSNGKLTLKMEFSI